MRRRTATPWWLLLVMLGSVQAVRAAATLDHLQAAYNGESNARVRYLAFAKQADKEGYRQVARLFRAAARAEGIHASNHSKVIHTLGATPRNQIKPVSVGTTRENVASALKGEEYERDTMYPQFVAQAEKDKLDAAVETFDYAMAAEAEHAKLYQTALDNLEAWRAPGASFQVCPVCGFTTDKPITACPTCATPKDKFITVD